MKKMCIGFLTKNEAYENMEGKTINLINADDFIERLKRLANDDHNKSASTTWANAFDEIVDMIENNPTMTVYGYNTQDLIVFADACRKNNITDENLHDFCVNVQSAMKYIIQSIFAYTITEEEDE